MTTALLVLLQVAVPLLCGLAVTAYLRGVTRRLLLDLCGTDDRAEFWVRITAVLNTAAPLALVLLFGHDCSNAPAGEIVRQSLSLSLIGILVGVALLARGIWRQVPRAAAAPDAGRT